MLELCGTLNPVASAPCAPLPYAQENRARPRACFPFTGTLAALAGGWVLRFIFVNCLRILLCH